MERYLTNPYDRREADVKYGNISPGYEHGFWKNARINADDEFHCSPASDAEAAIPGNSDSFIDTLTRDRLKFDYLSAHVIRQMLSERQTLRYRTHNEIMGGITDVSGNISCCENLRYNPFAEKRKDQLSKLKLDLERQSRDEDLNAWRDVVELRRALVDAERKYDSAKLRTGIFHSINNSDDNKDSYHRANTGSM